MTVTENLDALGSWSINLSDTTPASTLSQLGYFGHIAVFRGVMDLSAYTDASLLATARYVGVLTEKVDQGRQLSGDGMLRWLGDGDHKGKVLETKLVLTGRSLTYCLGQILPPSVTLGTVHDPGGTYTGTHQWQTPRDVLDIICAAFGVEYRVNGNGTLDVGTAAQLYNTTAPKAIISARDASGGRDMDLEALSGQFEPDVSAIDYSTRIVLVGQSTDSTGTSTQFAEATADALSVPYKDIHGNTVQITRMVSDSGQTSGSVTAAAQLQLNRFNRLAQVLKVTASDYDMSGNFAVGDSAYVFDPDNGIVDSGTEVMFRGEVIHPQIIRISGLTWNVTEGHTVAFRTQGGAWIDLTRWVLWESGTDQVTVGDLPKTLTSSDNPVLDRQNAIGDASVPSPPTGLTLATSSQQATDGVATATLSASWTAPTTNTDGSLITDLSYYEVQYVWVGRAGTWDTRYTPDTFIDIPGLACGLVYEMQVSAVDTAGHTSAPTALAQITLAADTTPPNAPSDPMVDSYLGQLRVAWDGKDNTGAAMPLDFAVVEVHVSAVNGFTPDSSPGSATLVSQLSAPGKAFAVAPYGVTMYAKLVAVDASNNHSAPSGQASGATTQVSDPDIASLSVGKLTAGTMTADVVVGGRFATALTGARVEVNSLGFQKFDTDGITKLVSITGVEALLTGVIKTALTGRRIEIGAGGVYGTINFYAPDGTNSQVTAYTTGSGKEAVRMGVPISGTSELWNTVCVQNDETVAMIGKKTEVLYGGGVGFTSFAVGYIASKGVPGGDVPTPAYVYVVDDNPSYNYSTKYGVLVQAQDLSSASSANVWFWPDPTRLTAKLQINKTLNNDNAHSPSILFVTQNNTGVTVRGYDLDGLEVVTPSETAYSPVNASAFNVNSEARFKENVRPLDVDPVEVLRGIDVVRFRRKNEEPPATGTLDKHGQPPPRAVLHTHDEVGVLAENTHDLLRRDHGEHSFVDLGTTLFTMVAALQKVDARLQALEGKP